MLTAIETTATIRANRQLLLDEDLPENAPPRVRVVVYIEDERDKDDFTETEWLKAGSANDAFDFLNEQTEDIYSLEDGKPLADEI